mmetsp:Transcript_44249/g.86856  ORF Transcript_44249/g.86856 Transcript_44249/m.86856 type:complete len:467 (+) Transcript_44249:100-1500(+)
MVEGPGATNNGAKVKKCVGSRVFRSEIPSGVPFSLETRELLTAFTVGKELFLVFGPPQDGCLDDEVAVRLHFGMDGSLSVRNGGVRARTNRSWTSKHEISLEIAFVKKIPSAFSGDAVEGRGSPSARGTATAGKKRKSPIDRDMEMKGSIIVEARGTTVKGNVSASAALSKLDRLRCRDSCSPHFEAPRVFEVLRNAGRSNPHLIISDAILDQNNFPGVGNIIKVEGLHMAKVDPRRSVVSLSDAEVRRIVAFCRRYSMDWQRSGRAPEKHVYNRTVCGTCGGATVSMRKIGGHVGSSPDAGHNHMSRTTFWCTLCQPADDGPGDAARPNNMLQMNAHQRALSHESRTASQQLLLLRPHLDRQCPEHGPRRTILRRVKKEGSSNLSRIFRTCQARDCQFFAWADGHLPECRCGRRSVLRVSKTEKSGGRWFLGCSKGKGNSSACGYFVWAANNHLDPLGSLLTPLL